MKELFISSAFGPVRLAADAKGIRSVGFAPRLVRKKSSSALLKKCAKELKEYFKGSRKRFSVRLAPEGTSFQKKVWAQINQIPCGKTLTYSEIAAKVGHKKAARAVGSAAGANPICLIVPCHRVVGAKGLGGYAYGLDKKRKLLVREGATFQ